MTIFLYILGFIVFYFTGACVIYTYLFNRFARSDGSFSYSDKTDVYLLTALWPFYLIYLILIKAVLLILIKAVLPIVITPLHLMNWVALSIRNFRSKPKTIRGKVY